MQYFEKSLYDLTAYSENPLYYKCQELLDDKKNHMSITKKKDIKKIKKFFHKFFKYEEKYILIRLYICRKKDKYYNFACLIRDDNHAELFKFKTKTEKLKKNKLVEKINELLKSDDICIGTDNTKIVTHMDYRHISEIKTYNGKYYDEEAEDEENEGSIYISDFTDKFKIFMDCSEIRELFGVYLSTLFYSDLNLKYCVNVVSKQCELLIDIFDRMDCFDFPKRIVTERSTTSDLQKVFKKENKAVNIIIEDSKRTSIESYVNENYRKFSSCFIAYSEKTKFKGSQFAIINVPELDDDVMHGLRYALKGIGSSVCEFYNDVDVDEITVEKKKAKTLFDEQYVKNESKFKSTIYAVLKVYGLWLREKELISNSVYEEYMEKLAIKKNNTVPHKDDILKKIRTKLSSDVEDNSPKWFLYTNPTQNKELLCFENYAAINEFVGEDILKSESDLMKLRNKWKEKGYLFCNKTGTKYKVREKDRTAFIVDKIKVE